MEFPVWSFEHPEPKLQLLIFFPFSKPQIRGVFLRRPQRFLAEVSIYNGSTVVAYCPNPGSFAGCLTEGSPVLMWDSSDPKRKRRFTLRAIKQSQTWIGTDTHITNRLAEKSFVEGLIPGYESAVLINREPRNRRGCRFDFLFKDKHGELLVEVKSVMVAVDGVAQFPDSISLRATAHIRELAKLSKAGHRACLLFVIQRGDVQRMQVNRARDVSFARAIQLAINAGVQVTAVKHEVTASGFLSPIHVPFIN